MSGEEPCGLPALRLQLLQLTPGRRFQAEVSGEEDAVEWALESEVASIGLVDPWMKDQTLI